MKANKKEILLAGTLSFLLTFMHVAGWQLSMEYGSSVHQSAFFQNIGILSPLGCLLWGILEFTALSIVIYHTFRFLTKRSSGHLEHTGSPDPVANHIVGWGTFIIMSILWLIFLWGCYPGYYNYDVGNQLPQFLYEEVPYNSHHPLLHTLLLGSIASFGYRIHTADISFGIFLYNAFQMIVCAGCLNYSLRYIYKQTRRRLITMIAFCFYTFCPSIVMFAMCTTKDILCFSFLLVGIIRFMELVEQINLGKTPGKIHWCSVGLFWLLSCLLRNNIAYALVLFIPFTLLLLRKEYTKQFLLYLGVLAAYFLINKSLLIALDATPGSFNEAMCVPYQQIAALYTQEGENAFTPKELDLLSQAIPPNELFTNDPVMGDSIKSNFLPGLETIMANKWDYFSLWLKKGFQYPHIYIKAFLYKNYQAWYPGTALVDKNGPRYFDITDWQIEYGSPHWQGLYDFYAAIRYNEYTALPVLRLLLSIGTMFWMTLVTWFYGIHRGNKSIILPLLLVLLVCITNFCGPVSDVRYYLILFYLFPVCIGCLTK